MAFVSLSIVIACRNARPTIHACLEALRASTHPVFECILVDDSSTDNSAELAESGGMQVVRLQVQGGPARARNIGAAAATGDIIVFLDSDVCVHPDTLARIAEHFENDPHLQAVIGSYDD